MRTPPNLTLLYTPSCFPGLCADTLTRPRRRFIPTTTVLNGSFPVDKIPNAPTHALGYSLLTDGAFAAQPGGNGLPVSLSKRGDGPFDVFEGLNSDRVTDDPFTISNNITVAPIAQAITVPGTTSSTLSYVAHQTQLVGSLANSSFTVNELDELPGVTVFVPTTQAWSGAADRINSTNATVVALQHIVQNRAAFTPLLRTQGSLVNAAGQDLYYEPSNHSIKVGNSWAQIIQSDIISKNGVIHTLDNVLFETNYNESRSIQAARSARRSFHGPVTGFIQDDNAGSTQGPDVPGPDANNPATGFKNSTVQGNDNGSNTTGSGGPNGTGSDTSGSGGNANGNSGSTNGNGNGNGNGSGNGNGNGNGGNGGRDNAAGSLYVHTVGLLGLVAVSAATLL